MLVLAYCMTQILKYRNQFRLYCYSFCCEVVLLSTYYITVILQNYIKIRFISMGLLYPSQSLSSPYLVDNHMRACELYIFLYVNTPVLICNSYISSTEKNVFPWHFTPSFIESTPILKCQEWF